MITAMINVRAHFVPAAQQNLTLSEIYEAACAAPQSVPAADGLASTGEMLVMCGLNRAQFNRLLDDMRRMRAAVPLKAVLTDTNAQWTADRLFAELSAERDAIARNAKAHSPVADDTTGADAP